MEDIYIVEKGDADSSVQVENFWQQLSEAIAFVEAKMGHDNIEYVRNKEKEEDGIVRYWESGNQYICIRLTVVD